MNRTDCALQPGMALVRAIDDLVAEIKTLIRDFMVRFKVEPLGRDERQID